MNGSNAVQYPVPRDWQMFERLCLALLSDIYATKFQRWGRSGQRQDGIDIYGKTLEGAIAAQCKGRQQGVGKGLRKSDIDNVCKDIDNGHVRVDKILVLTTLPDDVALHQYASQLSLKRQAAGQPSISIWGWDTISDYIGNSPRVQRSFYGSWFHKSTLRQRVVAAGVVIVMVGLVIFAVQAGWQRYGQARLNSIQQQTSVLQSLQQFNRQTGALQQAWHDCERLLAPQILLFSWDLQRHCIAPVKQHLDKSDALLENSSVALPAEIWTELNKQLQLMHEDYRQLLIASEATTNAEKDIINSWQQQCLIKHPDNAFYVEKQKSARDAFTWAVDQQSRLYFLMRDFMLPGMASMKARVQSLARQQMDRAAPAAMIEEANQLPLLLQQRNDYHFQPQPSPFTLAVTKIWSARTIKISGEDTPDIVEDLRWRQLYARALVMSLAGKKREIENLIQCGLLKPEARKWIDKPQFPAEEQAAD